MHKMVKTPPKWAMLCTGLYKFKRKQQKSQDVCLWGEGTVGDVAEDVLMRARLGFMSETWQKTELLP